MITIGSLVAQVAAGTMQLSHAHTAAIRMVFNMLLSRSR
jgi:hypothetical protein